MIDRSRSSVSPYRRAAISPYSARWFRGKKDASAESAESLISMRAHQRRPRRAGFHTRVFRDKVECFFCTIGRAFSPVVRLERLMAVASSCWIKIRYSIVKILQRQRTRQFCKRFHESSFRMTNIPDRVRTSAKGTRRKGDKFDLHFDSDTSRSERNRQRRDH